MGKRSCRAAVAGPTLDSEKGHCCAPQQHRRQRLLLTLPAKSSILSLPSLALNVMMTKMMGTMAQE